MLRLDCRKARAGLDWSPVWDLSTTLSRTVDWYRAYCERGEIRSVSDLEAYVAAAKASGAVWAAAT